MIKSNRALGQTAWNNDFAVPKIFIDFTFYRVQYSNFIRRYHYTIFDVDWGVTKWICTPKISSNLNTHELTAKVLEYDHLFLSPRAKWEYPYTYLPEQKLLAGLCRSRYLSKAGVCNPSSGKSYSLSYLKQKRQLRWSRYFRSFPMDLVSVEDIICFGNWFNWLKLLDIKSLPMPPMIPIERSIHACMI